MSRILFETPRQNLFTIEIAGAPVAWKRAGHRKKGVMFDMQRDVKLVWGINMRNQFQRKPFGPIPLGMFVHYYFAKPKTKRDEWAAMEDAFHFYRPDSSNLVKFVEDAANDIFYDDDCRIAQLVVEKRYSDNPRTLIEIYTL